MCRFGAGSQIAVGQPGWHGQRKQIGRRDAGLFIFELASGWLLQLLSFFDSSHEEIFDLNLATKSHVRQLLTGFIILEMF